MAGFDFRPPQFSEDTAWLPAWLQPHQVLLPCEHATDAPCEDATLLKETIVYGPPEHLLSKGDARCNCFHLFLSGESDSPVGSTPFSGNVLHFELHLSSADTLQHSLSQPHDILQKERPQSDEVQPMQSIHKTAAVQDEKSCQYILDDQACAAALLLPSSTPEISPKSTLQPLTTNNGKSRKKLQEKIESEGLLNADINDAVELSIAASEALVISELMKSGLPSDILPAAAILEIALRVKQARKASCLDKSEDGSAYLKDGINDEDRLSDLDDICMEDAFEDVGLSVLEVASTPDDLCEGDQRTSIQEYHIHSSHTDSSYVPNANFLEKHDQVRNTENKPQDIDFTGIPSQYKLCDVSSMTLSPKDFPLESLNVQRKKPCNDETFLGSNASGIESNIKACTHQLAQNTANTLDLTQIASKDDTKGVEFDVDGNTSFQTRSNVQSAYWIGDSRKASVENVVNGVVAERFRSRWLGGWSKKGFDVTVHGSRKIEKRIPQMFTREASFLTESMDVVMDESSMHKPETEPKRIVSSSISIEGIHRNADTLISLSQDLVGSSNFSLFDPLCSVVPCSISLDNSHVSHASHQRGFEEEAGKCLSPMPNAEHSIPSMSFACGKEHVTSQMSGDGLNVSRKLSSSLKMYSMVLSAKYGDPEEKYLYKNEATSLECEAKNRNASKAILESVVGKITSTETENKDVQGHQCAESCSPFMLNCGMQRRICTRDVIVSDSEESLKQVSISRATKTQLDNCRSEATVTGKTNFTSFTPFDSSLHSHLYNKQSQTNKRVRFSETEIEHHQSNIGQKLPSTSLTRSHSKTRKKVKDSSLRSKFGTRKEKCDSNYERRMLFQGLEFLLTGFSKLKEKELEVLIRKHGGATLFDVPSPSPYSIKNRESRCKNRQLPVVLSPKKVQTTKFLYGCAINTLLLKASWLTDSVMAGYSLPPRKYLILSFQAADRQRIRIGQSIPSCSCIFDKVGIMFYGKPSFCSKWGKIVKHGGGQVFKTLQWLVQSLKNGKNSVGAVVIEAESTVSRHLRQCASEQRLHMMPASWIVNSLHSGQLLPFKNDQSTTLHTNMMLKLPAPIDTSQEI